MKRLLIFIIAVVLCNTSQAQRQTFNNGMITQSGFYFTDNAYCFFDAMAKSKVVTLKIKTYNEPILSPVFIFTNKGKYCCVIDKVNKYGFSIINLKFYHIDLWKSLDTGIKRIEFYTGKQWYTIEINDNLNKLKNYGKLD